MACHATARWGEGDVPEPTVERLREILAELDAEDDEQTSVSVTHESGWRLGAYPDSLLVWDNLKDQEPRHMNKVPRERVLGLWMKLARGMLAEIEHEPWLPGCQD
jgi:hypothetical protein